jgi:thymidylate synthase (FAD)
MKELIGKRFPVLDHGHVVLLDYMGTDEAIAEAARTSYQKGTRSVSDNRTLIRYMARHGHTTPFECCTVKLHVMLPIVVERQWARHRTASWTEASGRYSVVGEELLATDPAAWRRQATSNKQGSSGLVTEWPDEQGLRQHAWQHYGAAEPGQYLSEREADLHRLAQEVYQERLKFGVAREQARKDLPLAMYTQKVWTQDLHNLFHFLMLRMDPHAQEEIRQYAEVIGNEIVAKLFPIAWEAFCDYRLNAIRLTAIDIEVIRAIAALGGAADVSAFFTNQR